MANNTSIKFPEPGAADLKSKAGQARVASSRTGGYDINIDYRNGGYASENRRTFSEAVLWATACLANLNV